MREGAVICGAELWVGIETYEQATQECERVSWNCPTVFHPMIHLRKARRGKLPPADFARIFALINPQEFQECFLSWIKSVAVLTDGKSLKH